MSLTYQSHGKGRTFILLHGFPFNKEIWTSFAGLFEDYQILAPDLPGFGGSPPLKTPFSLEDVANEVVSWINSLNADSPVIVGHSLGGYIALEVAKKTQPGGLVLFHSTALPDSSERKEMRNKALEFISYNGVAAFTSNFIEPLFFLKDKEAIALVKQIATQASVDAVTGYISAMRDRRDNTSVIRDTKVPILLIGGEKDAGIPNQSLQEQSRLSALAEAVIIPSIAHMGMIENAIECKKLITDFIQKKVVTRAR